MPSEQGRKGQGVAPSSLCRLKHKIDLPTNEMLVLFSRLKGSNAASSSEVILFAWSDRYLRDGNCSGTKPLGIVVRLLLLSIDQTHY